MWNYPLDESFLKQFGKHAKIAGAIFLLLGLAGIFFPVFMTLATVVFVSWLLLFAGIFAGVFTWTTDRSDWLGWLKAVVLVGVSLFMLFYPMNGVATVGLLLAIYFFMDAFVGFGMASNMHPKKGWWLWGLNALLSLVLGILFVIGWPFSSLYLVGLFVGISLFFDGFVLLFSGGQFTKLGK